MISVFYKGLRDLMQSFAKSYANHRAPALFLTGWQPCSSVAPGTWRSFLHLRLTRSLGLVPAALRVSRAAVETSHLDSHHPPLLRLLWQGWCGVQPLLRGQHVSSRICPPRPWAHPSGLPASLLGSIRGCQASFQSLKWWDGREL